MSIEIEDYGYFAETQWNSHLIQLHLYHIGHGECSDEEMIAAYTAHREILNRELQQKLDSLVQGKALDKTIMNALMAIKLKYESNLIWSKRTEPVL